ncbi:hypothetical protein PGT21_000506 [Puccinia graminis f. sp. tritici]|uniref:Uncharacterized protein n=1 Tax=Puccinia graminis f. sp. tritici TaxID=56615 RepID=A0A5B0N842_PUCGR|nr:hypothetical protein PGT21_000506 [Puccinia graminis f. sp. tritici]
MSAPTRDQEEHSKIVCRHPKPLELTSRRRSTNAICESSSASANRRLDLGCAFRIRNPCGALLKFSSSLFNTRHLSLEVRFGTKSVKWDPEAFPFAQTFAEVLAASFPQPPLLHSSRRSRFTLRIRAILSPVLDSFR